MAIVVKDYGASLHINRSHGSWYIYISDADDKYDFHGFRGVQTLSHAMLFGKDRVVQAIDQDLIFVKGEGDSGAAMYKKLFTTAIYYSFEGVVIMGYLGGCTLDADLKTAGEALAAMVFLTDARIAVSQGLIGYLYNDMIES